MAKTQTAPSDLDYALQFTDNEGYAAGDRAGYRIDVANLEDDAFRPIAYSVFHEATGICVGGFATQESADAAIERYNAYLAVTDDPPMTSVRAAELDADQRDQDGNGDPALPQAYVTGEEDTHNPVDAQVAAPAEEPAPAEG